MKRTKYDIQLWGIGEELSWKKLLVIEQLIGTLGHQNSDIEGSLNASAVLIELVETEKTLQIFMENEGKLVGHMFEIAVDPSNGPNQPYLLSVLLAMAK